MKIALVGNQNSGKTTLFNYLTASHAKIGNWPGVTIEKKTGTIRGTNHQITDLPGIYSLSPYSIEEEISKNYIFDEQPDLIINIIDATSLERSLYLTTQLMELDTKVIVALNMCDILEQKGLTIDEEKLSQLLGLKVVKISALKQTGIDDLITDINSKLPKKNIAVFDQKIENTTKELQKKIKAPHRKFISIKLLENDPRFTEYQTKTSTSSVKKLQTNYEDTLEEVIATERYRFIEEVKQASVKEAPVKEPITSKLDKIFLNKYLGFPIFVVIMFLVYYLSVGLIGSTTVEMVGEAMENLSVVVANYLTSINTSEILISLIVDGIIAGVGAVLGFVPQLIILFLCISLLETTGYMSRIAFLLDKIFRKIGLSGKSIIPFIVGSGCSVPGIMGTRIIENPDEREMTTILTPFIPCSAKLPIIALFSGYFFGSYSGLVSASLYFFAIIIIILSALILSKFKYKNTTKSYISELPDYKLPDYKYVLKDVWDKVIAFIKRAGSVILLCSIVIWFLLSFSFNLEYGVDISESILATIGKSISWVFYPMLGENSWAATVSAIQGLVAKEQVISSMAVIAGLAETTEEGAQIFASTTVFGHFTAASAYAFMVFNLFSAPCFGAIGAMKRELGSTKKLLLAVSFQTICAWVLAVIVYQIGSRITGVNIANIIIIIILALIISSILFLNHKNKNKCATCPYCKSCK